LPNALLLVTVAAVNDPWHGPSVSTAVTAATVKMSRGKTDFFAKKLHTAPIAFFQCFFMKAHAYLH